MSYKSLSNKKMIPIEYGKYYHIFNRGNNYENIFRQKSDYLYFLSLIDIFIISVTDIYAWALLNNHFHLLVRIKEEEEIGFLNSENIKSKDLKLKWETYFPKSTIPCHTDEGMPIKINIDLLSSDEGGQSSVNINKKEQSNIINNHTKKPNPHQQFKHLFNTYAKWYNKKYDRAGSLFTKNFKRKYVDNESYLKDLIVYIHNNPVHHEFTKDISEYNWTSYNTILSKKPTKLFRNEVLEHFEDRKNFAFVHKGKNNTDSIEDYLIE